ncbi:serine protease [Xylanimonas allomyrinae]|uniref:Serine protease n=1 Tax=Xylanimonas allomyrinae TaxID=2509459 RepID=A0A4V0YEM3_9MICO|nr:serine protease [Xylanimonas allomyrinae]
MRGAAAALTITATLAACGALPPFPTLPTAAPSDIAARDLVPSAPVAPSIAPSDAAALSPDGFGAVQRMAVRIRNVGCGRISTGSGFAIDDHTLITNRHVVADAASLQVSTYDGRDLDVATASTAALADLAVVRTKDALPSAPQLGDADPVAGDHVTVVGYPEGGALTVTEGRVLGPTSDPLHENLGEVLLTDAPVEPGSSGSAALDEAGRVVGVVYAKTDDERSLLVPVSTLRMLLTDTGAFTPVTPCS